MTRTALAGWILIVSTWSGQGLAQEPDLSWIAQDQLAARQVLVDFGDDPRFRGFIRAAVMIEAPVERVWAIITDCESATEYVKKVLSCVLLETLEDQDAQIFRQRVKFTWFLPSFEHDFRLDYEPFHRIMVSKASGPLEVLNGTWWFVPGGDRGTTLIYSLNFDPGLPIPRFVVGRTLRNDVPAILTSVRDRAEAAAP